MPDNPARHHFARTIFETISNQSILAGIYLFSAVLVFYLFGIAGLWSVVVATQCFATFNAVYLITVVLDIGAASATGVFSSAFVDSCGIFSAVRHANQVFAVDYLSHISLFLLLISIRVAESSAETEAHDYAAPDGPSWWRAVLRIVLDVAVVLKLSTETARHCGIAVFTDNFGGFLRRTLNGYWAILLHRRRMRLPTSAERRNRFSAQSPSDGDLVANEAYTSSRYLSPHSLWRTLQFYKTSSWWILAYHFVVLLAVLTCAA